MGRGLMEVRVRLMNLKPKKIHCLPLTRVATQFNYLLHNGLSSRNTFQLLIIFNNSILTVMLHK